MKRDDEREATLTLGILEAIDSQDDVTQRGLAKELGVALGLANSYLKRCVKKGLVKIHQAPANRYIYYLTPRGFAEKSRLTAEYLSSSLAYYNRAGQSLGQVFAAIEEQGNRQVMFAGMSELTEIARVRAYDYDVEVVGTFDHSATVTRFVGRPVWRDEERVPAFDCALFTDIRARAERYSALVERSNSATLYVPDILGGVRSDN